MSQVEVQPCGPTDREEWNTFVACSNNGTIFHDLDFLAYHPEGRFAFHNLMFRLHGEVIAILPGAISESTYRSPMGASLGGFVTEAGLTLADADAIVKAFIDYCRQAGITSISLTPPMQIYNDTFDEVMEYALLYNGFSLDRALYSSVIDLTRVQGKQDLSRNTRHKINKAVNKGVQIVQENDFDTFYPILLENKAKFDAKPTHTLEELHRIEERCPGMMTLFLARYKNEAIAGELLFAANRNCILNFYTMHRYEHRNLFSVNYIVEHAIRWSAAHDFKYYDYGVSCDTFSQNPLEPSWPLVRFKESMGSTGCMRKTWQVNLA